MATPLRLNKSVIIDVAATAAPLATDAGVWDLVRIQTPSGNAADVVLGDANIAADGSAGGNVLAKGTYYGDLAGLELRSLYCIGQAGDKLILNLFGPGVV